MFVREDLNLTLGGAAATLTRATDTESVRVARTDLRVNLTAVDPVIVLGETEVAATEDSLASLGTLLSVPASFLQRTKDRVSPATRSALLNDLIDYSAPDDMKVTLTGGGISEVAEWSAKPAVSRLDLLEVATNVLGEDAPVARWVDTPSFFGFDVYAPEGFAHGYGGDGVAPYADGNVRDDITAGGLRFGMNTKQRLAPFTQEWLYRLACTNGYEVERPGLRVDARGQTVEEVLRELEEMAQIAFGNVERDIAAFYEMREVPVDNPERTIRQIARERNLPDRSTMALIDLAAGEDLPDSPSMFDVVNLVTNYANSPSVRNDGGRLLLERAGGSAISDHSARCGHCQQKVNHR